MNIVDLLLGRRLSAGYGGISDLPTLTNPASATDIIVGKEAVNGVGKRLVGSLETEERSVDIIETAQEITPSAGKLLAKVTVPGLVAKIENKVLTIRLVRESE